MQTQVIRFHDAELLGEQDGDTVWIPVRPICEAIGVRGEDYIKAINVDEILSRVRAVRPVHDASGRVQDMVCLPLHHVHGWLFGIQASKVKVEVRPRLLLFKQECYAALYEYFYGYVGRLRADAKREYELLSRNKELNRTVRHSMDEHRTNVLEIQAIQNRRAEVYHLEPLHIGAEVKLSKRRFPGRQLSIEPEVE